MRIVTNPGSNLSERVAAHYGVHVLPQKIVVDGVEHDTRSGLTHAMVDRWVRAARQHPHVLGTSAAEFIEVFKRLAHDDGEILAMMTSRKIIGSYTAAVSAARTLRATAGQERTRVEVVDSMSTDLGAGLCTMYAGEAARAGRPLADAAADCARFAEGGATMLTVATLDNLVKGGRASFLRAWLANLLDVSPIISFVDGELAAIGKVSRSSNVEGALVDALVARLGGRRSVWAGVAHGGAPEKAQRAAAALSSALDVVYLAQRPLSPSIYLHGGPGSIAVWAYPIDALRWAPRDPPPAM